MKNIIMAVTGASGARYARRLAQMFASNELHLHLVISDPGRIILTTELELTELTVATLLDHSATNVTLYPCQDIGARLASGSFITDGMVICPCSGHTLAAIANGMGDNLITRAALVTLKENRRLILVPREMPLNQIDLANMLRVSQAGGLICPACPGFYLRPRSVDDLVDFVVGRVLDLLQIPHQLATRWNPDPPS
ncbi:MAG: UbiX family flavin prenyltransferase [Planctomycetota bacterium]